MKRDWVSFVIVLMLVAVVLYCVAYLLRELFIVQPDLG